MAISIPHSFTNGAIAEAAEVNANFNEVATFVNALQDGTGLDSGIITTAKLADSAVIASKLGSDAVTSVKILDGAVGATKLADRSVGSSKLDNMTLNAQTGTTYTLVLSDAHKFVTLSNASAVTLTVPPNSSAAFDVGDQVNIMQLGAGQVTIAAGAGVTIRSAGSKLKTNAQYAVATLLKIATDEWVAVGNLAA